MFMAHDSLLPTEADSVCVWGGGERNRNIKSNSLIAKGGVKIHCYFMLVKTDFPSIVIKADVIVLCFRL